MPLIPELRFRRARARREAALRRGHPTPAPPAGVAPAAPAARRIDPPQDAAFYSCPCGYAWNAAVTTSVACPHCGTRQAW